MQPRKAFLVLAAVMALLIWAGVPGPVLAAPEPVLQLPPMPYRVVMGTFPDVESARKQAQQLKTFGIEGALSEADGHVEVVIGFFPSLTTAKIFAAVLQQQGFPVQVVKSVVPVAQHKAREFSLDLASTAGTRSLEEDRFGLTGAVTGFREDLSSSEAEIVLQGDKVQDRWLTSKINQACDPLATQNLTPPAFGRLQVSIE